MAGESAKQSHDRDQRTRHSQSLSQGEWKPNVLNRSLTMEAADFAGR
jgi:hypothetical protein